MEPQKNDKTEKRSHWDMRPYLAIGGMAFIVFCCCLVVGFVFFRFDKVAQVLSKIMGALQPIIIGGILAYLLQLSDRGRMGGFIQFPSISRLSQTDST